MSDPAEQLREELASVDADINGTLPGETNKPGPAGETDEPAAPATVSESQTIQAVLGAAVAVLAPMFPSLKQVYTPETIQAVGDVTEPLAKKHGWDVSAWLTRYAEEIAFAGVMLPLGYGTYQAVVFDLRQAEAAADKNKGGKPETGKDAEGKAPENGADQVTAHKLNLGGGDG